MTTLRRQLVEQELQKDQFNQLITTNQTIRQVDGIGAVVVHPGDVVVESKETDNCFFLLAGQHTAIAQSKNETRIMGAPGATVARQSVFRGRCIVEGLRFLSTAGGGNKNAPLVVLRDNATVIFRDCIFERTNTDSADWISMTSGCKLHAIGCTFVGTPSTGECVANAGAVVNAGVWAANLTGRPIGANTTVVFLT
jgi:hypothetical protein